MATCVSYVRWNLLNVFVCVRACASVRRARVRMPHKSVHCCLQVCMNARMHTYIVRPYRYILLYQNKVALGFIVHHAFF